MYELLAEHWFAWGVLPLLIFLSRIVDVSIGTIRMISVTRGHIPLSMVLGFFEVLIWLVAIGQIMANLSNPVTYVAYAAGFATGNGVGMLIERRLSMGFVTLRVITRMDATELVEALRKGEHGVTVVDAEGATGPVKVLYMILRRRNLPPVLEMVAKYNPNAFYTIEDVRSLNQGVIASASQQLRPRESRFTLFRSLRKAK